MLTNLSDLAHLVESHAQRLQRAHQAVTQAEEMKKRAEKDIADLTPDHERLFKMYEDALHAAKDDVLNPKKADDGVV